MNKDKILAVADAIERDSIPDVTFDMGNWLNAEENSQGHSCGTTACIAGYAYVMKKGMPIEPILPSSDTVSVVAQNAFDLDYEVSRELFIMTQASGYPVLMQDVTPAVAASCLRHLAETGKVDWPRAFANPSTAKELL